MSATKSKWSEITVDDDAKGSDKGKGQEIRRESEPQEEKYNWDVDDLYILAISIQMGAKKLRKLQKDIQRKQKKVDSGKTSTKLKAIQDTYFITLNDLHIYAPQLQTILDNTKDRTGLPGRTFRKTYSLNEKYKFVNRDKEELEIERDSLSRKNTRLTDENLRLKSEITTLAEALKNSKADKKSFRLSEPNADVAAQLAEAKKTIDELKAKIEKLEEEKRKSEYELQRQEAKTNQLTGQLDADRKAKDEALVRYKENWRKAEDETIQLEKNIRELNRTIEEYKNEKVALHLNHKEELGVQKEDNRKLKERLEEEKKKSEYELQRLETKTNQMTCQLDTERKAKEDALIRLEKIKKDFEHEVKSLKTQYKRLVEEKRKSEYELQRLEKRYKDCELEVQTLRDQCKSKKEHEEKKMLPDESYDCHGQQNKLVATGRAKRMVSDPSDTKSTSDQYSTSALGMAQNTQLLEEEKRKADELHRLEKINKDFELEVKRLKDQCNRLEEEKKKSEYELQRLEAKTNQLTAQLDTERKAQEDALIRLSSMETTNVRDNNPNIADLSDPNRPTKLSEQFSELYDNEWTDAFDELEKTLNIELKEEETMEIKIISYLRDILLEIHSLCSGESSRRLNGIEEAFVKPFDKINTKVPTEVFKMIKDAIKSMAPYCIEGIRKIVLVHLEKTYSGNPVGGCLQHKNVKRYIKKCTDVCWYMSVQDPQVFMDGNKSPNGNFDFNKHIEYTKKGAYEEYVVWPVLYLYKDGQMLSKGVAQGKKRENKKEMTEH